MTATASWAGGAPPSTIGAGSALAIAPALVTLLVAPSWDRPWARAAVVFGWAALTAIGVGFAGGLASPAVALGLVAPAIALRLEDRAAAAEAAGFAVAGFALAAVAAAARPPGADLFVAPPALAIAALLVAGYLVAGRDPARAPEAPAAVAVTPPQPASALRIAELGHELRTPLTHILGFSEIMQRQLYGPLNERYLEYVDLIQRSGRNLLGLINGLMDVSRMEAGRYRIEKERFDVRDLALEVVRLTADQATAKGLVIEADVGETPVPVDADPRAVRQILMNLATNGIKFTPDGGRVRIRVRGEGRMVRLEAEDTGPGIAPEERARLGRAFERGARAEGVEGVGLGLALVRGFAELHDGGLSFHEAPEGGALVRVEAPIGAPGDQVSG